MLALQRVGNRERVVRGHDDRLRQERVVVAVAVPGQRIGRGAALAIDHRVAVDRLDELAPDLGIVDHQPAVAGHVVRPVGIAELAELILGVELARHVEANAPDVVAARSPGARPAAPGRTRSDQNASHSFGMSGEREARALQQALPDVDVVGGTPHRQRIERPLPGLLVE